ncbi:unnamed protein product [Caenorhabditis auriculariae]|uniref:CX domain-containing protein n=1 Tax=Caenorhabditis auriculariae TaxID=2777116 RepID=A0A8S1HVE7_9PELO|nr:unnamed protein product [Caenorhabditis auriculariae]
MTPIAIILIVLPLFCAETQENATEFVFNPKFALPTDSYGPVDYERPPVCADIPCDAKCCDERRLVVFLPEQSWL